MAEYVAVESLKRPGFEDDFYGGVLEDVVVGLIARGVLEGKTVRGKKMVLADERLERILQLGIEPLVHGQQGWSFVAIDAPIERVLEVVREVVEVAEVRQRVKVYDNQMGRGADPPANVQPLFLVKPRGSNWTVLVIRVHWSAIEDVELAEMVAREASKRLKTRAVTAFDDDVSGSYAWEWRNGKKGEEWSSNDEGFYLKFYEREIAGPSSWMSSIDGEHVFMSRYAAAIERVDYIGMVQTKRKEAASAKKGSKAPPVMISAEDLLRQYAEAMGAPISKKKTKKGKSK